MLTLDFYQEEKTNTKDIIGPNDKNEVRLDQLASNIEQYGSMSTFLTPTITLKLYS